MAHHVKIETRGAVLIALKRESMEALPGEAKGVHRTADGGDRALDLCVGTKVSMELVKHHLIVEEGHEFEQLHALLVSHDLIV